RRQRGEIGIGPEPAPGAAGLLLGGEQGCCAALVLDAGRNAGGALRDKSMLQGDGCAIRESKGDDTAIAVAIGSEFFEAQHLTGGERFQRGAALLRHLDGRKPQLASILEQQRTAVAHGGDFDYAGRRELAGLFRQRGKTGPRKRSTNTDARGNMMSQWHTGTIADCEGLWPVI